jgi:hypothetical protein
MMQQVMRDTGKVKKYFCITFAFLALLMSIFSCTSSTDRSIKDQGGIIVLSTKNHTVKAVKTASMDGTYILYNAQAFLDPDSLSYLDGSISAMIKEDADKLKAEGGKDRKQENQGNAGKEKNIQYFNVIAANKPAQKQIKLLMELTSRKLHPVIELSMTEIQVTDLTYKKSKVYLSGDVQRQYLVDKIRILDKNYRL